MVCAARTASDVDAVAEQVRALGRRAIAVPTDVTVAADLEQLVAATLDAFGRVDILVNNAGGTGPRPAMATSEAYFETALRFNVTAAFLLTKLAARAMVEALRPGLKGVYNVVGPGEVPLSAVLRELGRTPIPVPHPIARPLLGTLFRYRLANFPPPELDHIQFLCMVDGSRWTQDVGWVPQHSMKDTIRSVDGERAAA